MLRYGVDAMKMKPFTAGKEREGVMDRIFFNFPHVGGKTKDVNRQVRYNQGPSLLSLPSSLIPLLTLCFGKTELLVSFFKNAIKSLSPREGSSIIVTLFEGEPYTLWNIRDLGRHSGLEVKRSWRFQAGAYPGYRHARTLGVVKGRNGEMGGGWKGEERKARSYEFVRKGEGFVAGGGKGKKEESSGDEDEEGDESLNWDEIKKGDESLGDEDMEDHRTETDDDEDGD